MIHLLGIDYGQARMGLAVSDDLGMLAHPLETIDLTKGINPLSRISEIAEERGITALILGIPYSSDGSIGPSAKKVLEFRKRLEEAMPHLAIHEVDESHTTKEAYERFREAGKREIQARKRIDQAAAVLILQSFLDQNLPLEEDPNIP
ncbi:MAG: Holliday junction resolvase RuvX [Verrucomicrobiota bacterium]